MREKLRILIIESEKTHFDTILDAMRRSDFDLLSHCVQDERTLRTVLDSEKWDIILSAYRMPDFSASEAFKVLCDTHKDIPFIVLCSETDENEALTLMRGGARDCVLYADAHRLPAILLREYTDARKRLACAHTIKDLAKEKQFIQELFDVIPIPIFYKDIDGRYQSVNSAFEEFFGKPRDDIRGKTVFDINPPKLAQLYYKQDQALFESGGRQTYEALVCDSHGQTRDVVFNKALFFDEDGTAQGLIGTVLDITKRKDAERRLKTSEQKEKAHQLYLSAVMNSAMVGIVVMDAETYRIIDINPNAAKLIGTSPNELKGMICKDVICRENHDRCPALEKKDSLALHEQFLQRSDGTMVPVLKAVRRVSVLDKEYLIDSFIDISKQKESEKARLLLEKELQQAHKLESIGTLAAGIAHEINTPIQFIDNNSQFIQKGIDRILGLVAEYRRLLEECSKKAGDKSVLENARNYEKKIKLAFLQEEIPKAIAQTQEGVERVSKIVSSMKDFSHMGNEVKTYEDVNKAIETTVTIARNEWKYVAALDMQLDETLPQVECVIGDIKQVILNLIVNASHTIRDKAHSTAGEKGQIVIQTKSDKLHIYITVTDSGMGIPEEIQERVFEHFFTTKEVGKGTGQGLSMAYQTIVEKHKGSINFTSRQGEGTSFIIQLPITAPKDARESSDNKEKK